jgi:predicted NBD/HSP70 family sugar kinase
MADSSTPGAVGAHGATTLPAVEVESYNVELKDDEGFLGDRVCKAAFRDIVTEWRKRVGKPGDDPLGDEPSEELSKRQLDELITKGDPEAAGIIQSAIEEFAQELAHVIRRFTKLKAWRDTERIAVGGGFRDSRVGELAIGRAAAILKAEKANIDLTPIHADPDEAGLIGAAHLAPLWMFEGHDALLGVDIGGTNIRAGIVSLNLKKSPDLSKLCVWKSELWRHGDEKKVERDSAVKKLIDMLSRLIARAEKEKLRLAPFIGVGCPGVIEPDGTIDRGAQNLPGKWEGHSFNLPAVLRGGIPEIGDHETVVILHNDAVVQGLSEIPFMTDVTHWGTLTIGTGLGNVRFSNRSRKSKGER